MNRRTQHAIQSRLRRPTAPLGARLHGFTLLEMSITLLIAGILLTGLIMTLGAQQDASREAETRRYLAQAREALYGFAMTNGRLPCPATATLASGAANAGLARAPTGAGCTGGEVGVLPWATLGLSETDAYGSRVTYRVTAAFASSIPGTSPFGCPLAPATPPTESTFALCARGTMEVRALGGVPLIAGDLTNNQGLAAVLVAHGPNRSGSYNSSGVQSPVGGADEAENSDNDTEFRVGPRRDAGAAGGEFDDEVEWIVPSILMHRMVQAGRLP